VTYLPNGIWWNGTDPTSEDTDQDGIKDTDEVQGYTVYFTRDGQPYSYWNSTLNDYLNSASVKTSPVAQDTDGDGLTDGQERDGWTVQIIWWEGEKQKSKVIKITSNPADAKNLGLDTDQDGIKDYDELHPEEVFPWLSEVPNLNRSATFNPYVKDRTPPVIVDARADREDVFLRVKVRVLEPSLVVYYHVEAWYNVANARHSVVEGNMLSSLEWITAVYTIDTTTVAAVGYSVSVKVWDECENAVEWSKKVDGLFTGVFDTLSAIWNAIAGALQKAWEAVANAVNAIWNWLVETITGIINAAMAPIKSAIDSFGKFISDHIKILERLFNGEDVHFTLLTDILANPFLTIALALPAILLTVYGIVSACTAGLGMLALELASGLVSDLIVNMFLTSPQSATIGSVSGGILESIGDVLDPLFQNVELDTLDIISLASAVIGLLLSVFITYCVDLVLKAQVFQAQEKLKDIERELGELASAASAAGVGTTAFKAYMEKIAERCKEFARLRTTINRAPVAMKENRAMGALSVGFGLASIILVLVGAAIKDWSETQKAILFGLSVGVGIGGLLTFAYSLITGGGIPGVRFLSIIGMALSAVGTAAGAYEAFQK
jgi:hypothetical protein